MRHSHTARRISDIPVALRRSRELLQRDRWTAARLRTHQRVLLGELVRHATANSAFYRRLYRGIDVGGELELERLPVIDKAAMMDHFDELITDPRLRLADLEAHLDGLHRDALYLGRYRVMSTAGTTGRKGVFVADRDEWRAYLAGLLRQ